MGLGNAQRVSASVYHRALLATRLEYRKTAIKYLVAKLVFKIGKQGFRQAGIGFASNGFVMTNPNYCLLGDTPKPSRPLQK